MKLLGVALAGAICLGACVYTPAETKVAEATVGPNGEPLVCERVDVPGSIFPDRVCMSEEAWARHKEEGSKAAADAQRKGLGTGDPNAG